MRKVCAYAMGLGMLVPQWCAAQNLVTNGSFEELVACPTHYGQLQLAQNWFRGGVLSPDLMNRCDEGDTCGVPTNTWGYQVPASGDGYAGMWAYSMAGPGFGAHEVIGTRLVEPLIPGNTYWAEVKICWTSSAPDWELLCRYATDKMGICFHNDSLFLESDWLPWQDYAQVYTEDIVSDSAAWTTISGWFIADSAYSFVYVGNFFGDDLTDTLLIDPNGDLTVSYYYVDDVCVSADPADCDFDTGIEPNREPREAVWVDAQGQLRIILSDERSAHISVFDAAGHMVGQRPNATGSLSIPLNGLSAGIYLVLVETSSRRHAHRIAISR